MKKIISSVAKIMFAAATVPLCFVKMYIGIGHLPDQTGEIVKVVFRHSMYENICDGVHPIIMYAYFALVLVSGVLSAVSLKSDSKKLQRVSNIAFGALIGVFAVLLLYATTVNRGY